MSYTNNYYGWTEQVTTLTTNELTAGLSLVVKSLAGRLLAAGYTPGVVRLDCAVATANGVREAIEAHSREVPASTKLVTGPKPKRRQGNKETNPRGNKT